MKVSFKEFDSVYQDFVNSVADFMNPEMQGKMAMHNVAWDQPYDFRRYLVLSSRRFYYTYLEIPEDAEHCCDIGGFWGVLPLTLTKLGYKATMTEVLEFYDDSFNPLFDFIRSHNVEILDIDPFSHPLSENKYDFVSILAVLEHIPDSLSYFLANVKSSLTPSAHLYCDVPNIAYYFKRKDLLLGKTPLPDIINIYNSRKPFIGHHHEFTVGELLRLFEVAGFSNTVLNRFNYSINVNIKFALQNPIAIMCLRCFPNMREIIGAGFEVRN